VPVRRCSLLLPLARSSSWTGRANRHPAVRSPWRFDDLGRGKNSLELPQARGHDCFLLLGLQIVIVLLRLTEAQGLPEALGKLHAKLLPEPSQFVAEGALALAGDQGTGHRPRLPLGLSGSIEDSCSRCH
jgi:hypothetical protein